MNIILALVIACTALFAQPTQPASQPTFSLPPALTVQCQEDQPCWDCHTMGNHTCDVTTTATAQDAWDTFESFDFQPTTATTVQYSRTLDNDSFVLTQTEFALESTTIPGHWHIFQSVAVTAQPTA